MTIPCWLRFRKGETYGRYQSIFFVPSWYSKQWWKSYHTWYYCND